MAKSLLFAAMLQVAVTLQPGERATVTCEGQLGPITSVDGGVAIPCEAAPPPPPGTVVLGDSLPLAANGGGVIIHASSGFFVAGPWTLPRLTADGAYQVDDRPGGGFTGRGCTLDSIEVYVGGDYRGETDGHAMVRVYAAGTAQVTSGLATPTPGWIAGSEPQRLTSDDDVRWRRFTFAAANRVPTAPGMWFAVDWQPDTNDFLNLLVVRFAVFDGVHPFLNDGVSRRTTDRSGVPLASPAFRVYEVCD